MDYKAVFFDFDYTLGDATEAIVAGFQYAFAKMGLPEPEREAVRRTIGMMLEDEYTVLTGDSGPENRARFRKLYTEKAGPLQVESTRLFPGAAELLTALHRQGIPAGIVSTKKTGTLRDVLEARGVAHLLTSIVGGDQVSAPKPDPQGLLASVNALGLAPAEVLFCGDTTIDGETARRAGTHFCAVLNGTTGFGMAPLIASAEAGEAALNYSFSVETDASIVSAAMINGDADIAALPTNAAATLYNRTEGDVQLLALNTLGVLYLVSDGSVEVSSVEDLRGQTVYAPAQNPTFIFQYICEQNGLAVGETNQINIEDGKTLVIKYLGLGDRNEDGTRSVVFELNGARREVSVPDPSAPDTGKRVVMADPADKSQIGASIPGMVSKVAVKPGDTVKVNQVVAIIEAMKMETSVVALTDGKIGELFIEPGRTVKAGELLMTVV